MRSGDRPGLQNRRAAGFLSPVRSTRTRFRQLNGLSWACDPLRDPLQANPATFEAARAISSVKFIPLYFVGALEKLIVAFQVRYCHLESLGVFVTHPYKRIAFRVD